MPDTIRVYWDSQDPTNNGWAYKWTHGENREHEDSGVIDGHSDDDLDGAIQTACWELDFPELTPDDFATHSSEGGWAVWESEPE